MKNTKIVSAPFSWNDNLSEIAIEDFNLITDRLSYCTSQSIGMALAKLEMIEKLVKDKKIEIDLDKEINEINIKPCPFCGEIPKVREYKDKFEASKDCCMIECVNEDCEIQPFTMVLYKEQAIKEWNTRKG